MLLVLSAPASAFNAGLSKPPSEIDRSNPMATVDGLLGEARRGHIATAAQYLLLDDVPVEQQVAVGERVARRLRFMLDRHPLDAATLAKDAEEGPGSLVLAVLDMDGRPAPIRLVRLRAGDSAVWLFAPDTVRAVAALGTGYDPPFVERVPHFLFRTGFGLEFWQWAGLLFCVVVAFLAGGLGEKLLLGAVRGLSRLTSASSFDELARGLHGPLRVLAGIGVYQAIQPRLLLTPGWEHGSGLVCRSLAIFAATWFSVRALKVARAAIDRRLDALGTGAAAAARTQVAVLWRVLDVVIYLLALATLLMQFNEVRTVGVSLLASAGVAGVVLGLAAQKSLGAVFSGIQLSISQPIRIGDLVVVEGEQGTVVEISLANVVLRLWDNRHLIVPVAYFLEKTFQNWTRENVDMVGAVFLQLDYRLDVDALRAELDRILAGPAKTLWNGRLAQVQITDTSAQTATVRILASAAVNSVSDLSCLVREELLKFLRARPSWLPTQRVEHMAERDVSSER